MKKIPSTFWIAIVAALTAAIPVFAQYFSVTLPESYQWAAPFIVTVLGAVAKIIQDAYTEKKMRKLARAADPNYSAAPFWASWEFWKGVFFGHNQ